MRKIFLIISFFCCLLMQAQNYLIRYDLLKDQTALYKLGKRNDTVAVSHITPKNNSRIILQVENFNPFYWKATVTPYKKPVTEEKGSVGKLGFFSFLTTGIGSMVPKNFPSLNIPGFLTRGGPPATTEEKFLSNASLLNKYYAELSALGKRYSALDETAGRLNRLKYDNKMTEQEIKSKAADILKNVFPEGDLSAEDFISAGRNSDLRYMTAKDSMNILNSLLQKQSADLDPESRVNKNQTVKDILGESKLAMAVLDSLGLKTSNGAGIFSEQTNKVAAAYLSITQTSFKYNYSMNSDPDITDLKAEIYPLAEGGIKDTLVKYFPVETKILKLKNSVGIAFSHFPGSYHSYFVKPDTTIGKERGNLFVPILATYVHFYSSGRSGFKWGGTIGFGIPLFGEEKDFHFLLGISAILGRNEMVIISAGASGTKVNKLKSNYKVGDKVLPQDVNSLTKPVYDAGVFFSVSINFGSVNQRK